MRHMNANTKTLCLALATVGLLMGSSGCALPAIEGIFDDRDFALFDDTPEARSQVKDEVVLVFADIDEGDAHMRTVSVDLKGMDSLPVGVDITVGDGAWDSTLPSVDAVEGTLITEEIPGRGKLYTVGDDALRAVSVDGTLILTENDAGTVAGRFTVNLDDGGYLEGAFRSAQ